MKKQKDWFQTKARWSFPLQRWEGQIGRGFWMLSSFFLNPYPKTLFFIAYRGRRMWRWVGGWYGVEDWFEKHWLVAFSYIPLQGIKPTTWVCALTENWTCSLSVYGTMLQPTEPYQPGPECCFFDLAGCTSWDIIDLHSLDFCAFCMFIVYVVCNQKRIRTIAFEETVQHLKC